MQYATESESENDFQELLNVLNDEDLLRVRHRLNKRRKMRLVDLITAEIRKRETIWQQERREMKKAEGSV
jgi:hypothetical protein